MQSIGKEKKSTTSLCQAAQAIGPPPLWLDHQLQNHPPSSHHHKLSRVFLFYVNPSKLKLFPAFPAFVDLNLLNDSVEMEPERKLRNLFVTATKTSKDMAWIITFQRKLFSFSFVFIALFNMVYQFRVSF